MDLDEYNDKKEYTKSIDDYVPEIFEESGDDSELETDEEDNKVNISDIINQASDMSEEIAKMNILASQVKDDEEKEKLERKLKQQRKEELDKVKAETFFSYARKSSNYSIFKPTFLCFIYDHCIENWNNYDFPDENVFIFKKLVHHCLSNQPRYVKIMNEVKFNNDDLTSSIILTNHRRIFIMSIDDKKYNLKHDGHYYYL